MEKAKKTPVRKAQPAPRQGLFERVFESSLWNCRFAVLTAVVFGMAAALVLFFIASVDIIHTISGVIAGYVNATSDSLNDKVLAHIIGSIDMYLIAVVLIIFSFGLYELFISKIDVAEKHSSSKMLQIHSLDSLKDKITKVIIMVLIVTFFEKVLALNYSTPLDMLFFALSIFALTFGYYFLRRSDPHE